MTHHDDKAKELADRLRPEGIVHASGQMRLALIRLAGSFPNEMARDDEPGVWIHLKDHEQASKHLAQVLKLAGIMP